MDTIRSYIETMFSNWPVTEATIRVKTQLLEIMEDKYQELIDQGHSSNEAIGQVISEFGNIEELRQELGIEYQVNADEIPLPDLVEQERQKQVWGKILMDNYWIVISVFYFIMSFVTGWWHISWIIFVLAVVGESVIRQLVGLPKKDDDDDDDDEDEDDY